MRIKLESQIRHLNKSEREDARTDFTKIYDEFPVQVVWIYLKRIRFMKLGYISIVASGLMEDRVLPAAQLNGEEDVIVACECCCHLSLGHGWLTRCLHSKGYVS